MNFTRTLKIGIISGLVMGCFLFIGGAITSRIIYGPQFAPDGKFDPARMKAFYFIWTKLVIGVFFGVLFAFAAEFSGLMGKIKGFWQGIGCGVLFWLIISIWNISHPLIYGSFSVQNETFWLIYSLWGFAALGGMFGRFGKKQEGLN